MPWLRSIACFENAKTMAGNTDLTNRTTHLLLTVLRELIRNDCLKNWSLNIRFKKNSIAHTFPGSCPQVMCLQRIITVSVWIYNDLEIFFIIIKHFSLIVFDCSWHRMTDDWHRKLLLSVTDTVDLTLSQHMEPLLSPNFNVKIAIK